MQIQLCLLLFFFISIVTSLPTVYKYNENKLLEPDLVPVSSTVIPLPVYQVSYGIEVGLKDKKMKKIEEPITLITAKTKLKPTGVKPKSDDISKIKQITKKEFDN